MSEWKRGPLPPNTWNWGGVVTAKCLDAQGRAHGFLLADFKGDHADAFIPGEVTPERVEAADVFYYDNSLEMPPGPYEDKK